MLGNQGEQRLSRARDECRSCDGRSPCSRCAGDERVVARRRAEPGAGSIVRGPGLGSLADLGPGHPLDARARADFEPLFGHDFGGVRVHTGSGAARSARALEAHAFTLGRDIVFGAGRYAPGTPHGRELLAHELTHVVQQRRGGGMPRRWTAVGSSHDRLEREADVAARRVLRGEPAGALSVDGAPVLRRRTNFAGRSLSAEHRRHLADYVFDLIGVRPADMRGSVVGPRFLLHDTSGASSRATIEQNAADARGPMGSGPHVFVPASGLEIIQRPDFFDWRRPTTTEFERGTDRLDKPGREAGLRGVWSVTLPAERTTAIERALTGVGLSPAEIRAETRTAILELNASSGDIHTTAYWTVGQICARAASAGNAAVAEAGRDTDLGAACAAIVPVLNLRRARLGSTVSIELVQVGHRRGGNPNTCDPANPDALPLPSPAYSDDQYWNTVLMYLRAALQAGRWPEVTTHFVVDAFAGGHCDPRCFVLTRFYATIARVLAPLGHGGDSVYGVTPSYGTTSGTNTVWWHNATCHGSPPATT